jgi:hypothetical protein
MCVCSSVGGLGFNIGVLGGIAVWTFCMIQGQGIYTNYMGPGQIIFLGGEQTAHTDGKGKKPPLPQTQDMTPSHSTSRLPLPGASWADFNFNFSLKNLKVNLNSI